MAAGNGGSTRQKGLFRGIAWVAVVLVTIGLSMLSISGAWILSNNNYFYTGAIAGMEMTAFISLTMIVYAATPLRRYAGWGIFVVAVAVCIFNAERAMKETFGLSDSPAVLRVEANNLRARAKTQADVSEESRTRNVDREERLLEEIAKLEVERELMVSGNVRRAQERLCALGEYPCDRIDGIRAEITNAAMDSRARAIRSEIDVKNRQVENIRNGDATGESSTADVAVSSKADDLRSEAAAKDDLAKQIDNAIYWILLTLLGLELVRSVAVWAFLMDDTADMTDANTRTNEAKAKTEAAHAENDLDKAENPDLDTQPDDPVDTTLDDDETQDEEPDDENLILDEDLDETDEEVDAATAARRKNLEKARDAKKHIRDAADNVQKILVTDDRPFDEDAIGEAA